LSEGATCQSLTSSQPNGPSALGLSERREPELTTNNNFWKPVLQREAGMTRFDDSMESAIDIIRPLVDGAGFVPQLKVETQIENKALIETEAGIEINVNLEQAKKKHKKEI
jgi:hypothetical protein